MAAPLKQHTGPCGTPHEATAVDPPALALHTQVHGQGGPRGVCPHTKVVHMRTRTKILQEGDAGVQAGEMAPPDEDDARGGYHDG
jgi:hypothetical protein